LRGYKLSFLLAVILIAMAFITKIYDKKQFGNFKNDTGSYFLLIGGMFPVVYGYVEYKKKNR
jgi:undecaprenyl pyrophosphate phosphatase UppP